LKKKNHNSHTNLVELLLNWDAVLIKERHLSFASFSSFGEGGGKDEEKKWLSW